MMRFPIRSLPVSLMKSVGTPQRPSEIMALNVDPPGTAAVGWSFLKMISRTVSPIPITFRIVVLNCQQMIHSPSHSFDNTFHLHFEENRRQTGDGYSSFHDKDIHLQVVVLL